ncbi:hypothetical protein [Peribacillus acanthi]|uniref:hypothetical protein n=1 Tax=Peribacillus acanthi TaxID=2171554 RepID=UPI000D3E1E1A|nr:hypothetical protein [Peribacillus acanthi]
MSIKRQTEEGNYIITEYDNGTIEKVVKMNPPIFEEILKSPSLEDRLTALEEATNILLGL